MQIHRISQSLWQWSPHFLMHLFSSEAKAYAEKKEGVKANSYSSKKWEYCHSIFLPFNVASNISSDTYIFVNGVCTPQ